MAHPDPVIAGLWQELVVMKQAHERLLGLVAALLDHTPVEDPQRCRIAREGEYWTIRHGASIVRLRPSKGLGYLAELVARPRIEVHALELAAAGDVGDAGPVLDHRARAEYRERLAELRGELDDARACNDFGRVERLERELAALAGQLANGVGLGGRDRRAAAAAERARVNVTRSLKSAIDRIVDADAELGRHFATTVRTGMFCCYDGALAWHVG
jgi:hypothetical protein